SRPAISGSSAGVVLTPSSVTDAHSGPGDSGISADRVSGRTQRVLDLKDPQHAEVEHAGGQHRVGPRLDSRAEVLWFACTPAGDERDRGDVPSRGDQFHVEAVP